MARLRQAVLRPAEPARSQACFGQRAAHGIKGVFWTAISRDATCLFLGVVGQRQPNFQLAGFLRVQGLPRRRIVHRDKVVLGFADTRHNVFLAFKEALNNVVKHARASEVWVRLQLQPDHFILEIEDDGRGLGDLDTNAAQSRDGLRNMRRRMEDIHGEFSIGPGTKGGTLVRLTVPIKMK